MSGPAYLGYIDNDELNSEALMRDYTENDELRDEQLDEVSGGGLSIPPPMKIMPVPYPNTGGTGGTISGDEPGVNTSLLSSRKMPKRGPAGS